MKAKPMESYTFYQLYLDYIESTDCEEFVQKRIYGKGAGGCSLNRVILTDLYYAFYLAKEKGFNEAREVYKR
jgi:hypothetical protein